jgi:hypothetical protein
MRKLQLILGWLAIAATLIILVIQVTTPLLSFPWWCPTTLVIIYWLCAFYVCFQIVKRLLFDHYQPMESFSERATIISVLLAYLAIICYGLLCLFTIDMQKHAQDSEVFRYDSGLGILLLVLWFVQRERPEHQIVFLNE